jgi:hypothetical protein
VLPETQTLLSLWRSLGQGAVPKRAQFSPLQVRPLLPYIFILDLADDVEDARFRLIGSAIEAAYGAQMTGRTIRDIDLGPGQPREALLKDYRVVAREGVAALSRQSFWVETTGPFCHERLLLPFETDRPGVISQIVGGFFFDSGYKGLAWKRSITKWREDANEIFPLATSGQSVSCQRPLIVSP